MKFRIILITNGLEGQMGGIQRISRSLISCLNEDPSLSQETQTWIWSSNDSQEIARQSTPSLKLRGFHGHYRQMWMASWRASLKGECEGVHVFHISLSPIAAILSLRLGCRFQLFLHGVEAWRRLNFKTRLALQRCGRLASNSSHTHREFLHWNPSFSRIPHLVIPLGISEQVANQALSVKCTSKPYFLCVTRLEEEYKGIDLLTSAFSEVIKKSPKMELIIIGEGPLRVKHEAFAKTLGLEHSVRFVGRAKDDELVEWYRNATGFILLSHGEGFGIAYLEAMAFAKPCIGLNLGAIPEVIEHEVTGLLVSPDRLTAICAMQKLIDQPDWAQKLGVQAQMRIRQNFLPTHFNSRLRDFIKMKI